MKKFGTKIALIVMAFVFVAVAVCTVATVSDASNGVEAFAETQTVGDLFVVNYSDSELELLINGSIREFLDTGKGDLTLLKNTLLEALRTIITNGILNGNGSLSTAGDVLPEGFDPSDFDWNSSETLSKFKDYVVDRLSDAEEFQKYVDGEYDLIIDYAIGTYIESKTENVEEEYSKIQSAIQDVVDQAYENAVENARTDLGEYFDEEEWIAKKELASEKVVERVETVQTSGGKVSVTFEQIVSAISGISVDGVELYSKANGLSTEALRTVVEALPRPSAVANMTASELATLTDWNLVVNTTYGNVPFALKVGFFGNVENIKSLAKLVADHVAVTTDGKNVEIELKVPQAFTSVLTKFYSSSRFTAEQKQFVFEMFDKTASELDVDEILTFVKGLDYKYFLTNLYNVEYMNNYFGKYVTKVLGHGFTDTTVDKLVEKACNFIAPKMARADALTTGELVEWLRANVPGLNNVGASSLTELAEKLKSVASKIDWANFDSAYVRDILTDSTVDLNGKISDYIEAFENSESLYNATVRYFEKAVNALPSFVKTHSILDCYDGDNLVASGNVNVQYKTVFSKLANVFTKLGMDKLAKYVGNASAVLDKQALDIDLTATVVVPGLNRVDYTFSGMVIRSGLLPAGLDGTVVSSLAKYEIIDGYTVKYWADLVTNERLDVMPDENVTLVPVYEFSAELSDGVRAVYDENNSYEISASVVGSDLSTYVYTWYKNGYQMDEGTSSIVVKNVSDNGEYYVVVTDPEEGLSTKSNIVKVDISAKALPTIGSWSIRSQYTYGENIAYQFNGIAESEQSIYSDVEYTFYQFVDGRPQQIEEPVGNWNAGMYKVSAVVRLDNENYVSADGKVKWTDSVIFRVNPKTLSLASAEWVVSDNLVYDGTEKTVALSLANSDLTEEEKEFVLSSIVYTVNDVETSNLAFVDAGVYLIKASASDNENANFKINSTIAKVVTVAKATATVEIDWSYTSPFTYDGTAHELQPIVTVRLGQNELSASEYSYKVYGVKSATNAGEYKAVVIVSSLSQNYTLSESVIAKDWVINPQTIEAPQVWDDEIELVYGQKVSVSYNGLAHPEYFTLIKYTFMQDGTELDVVNGRSILNVGEYTVKATFALANGNYAVSNSEDRSWTLSNTVTVSPKVLDLSDAVWTASANNVYNGRAKYVTLNLKDVELTAVERAYVISNLTYAVNGVASSYPVSLVEAGAYKITASLSASNYIVKVPSFDYKVLPATAKVSVNWGINGSLVYTGESIGLNVVVKVFANGVELGANDYISTVSGVTTAVEKGKYVAKVSVVLTNSNYTLSDNGQYTKEWSIVSTADSTWSSGKTFGNKDKVYIEIIDGNVPKDYTVSVKSSNITDDQKAKIKEAIENGDYELVSAYDIHFQDSSKVEKTVNGKFKVVLPIPQKYLNYSGKLAVVHIGDDGKVDVVVGAVRNGDNMEFVTDGFSVFAVIALSETAQRDIMPLIIVLIVIGVVLIITIILLVVLAKRHKNKKNDDDNNETPSEEKPVDETPVDETPVDETPAEETPVEETTEEVTSDEVPEEPVEAEETVEETTTEETVTEDVTEETVEETATEETVESQDEDTSATVEDEVAPVVDVMPVIDVEPVVPQEEPEIEVLDRSFTARLSQSGDTLKSNYDELKNHALSYKGVRSRVSWAYDSINKGRKKVCKIVIRGKSLNVFFALNPYALPEKYHCKSVGDVSKYASTPTKLKVKSGRSLKYAKELIDLVMSEYQVKQGTVGSEKYAPERMEDAELIEKGLIKVKLVKGGSNTPWNKN